MTSASPLSPTFYGHIASTQDALVLFEASLSGALNHAARRPHDRERASLIKSGNVFIYEEHSSGIKRWTDGVPWSPSRILGNFLVYRELERPFLPGEKKRAMKRSKRSPGISKATDPHGSSSSISSSYGTASAINSYLDSSLSNSLSKETERSLIGSLVDSYGFKEGGLVKKTISVTVGGVSHHLVSYYTVVDIMNDKFNNPTKDPRFRHITPRLDLVTKQNFRTPIDEVDSMDRMEDRAVYSAYPYMRSGYEMTNQAISNPVMSLPTPPVSYPTSNIYSNYGMSTSGVFYDSLGTHSSNTYNTHLAPAPGIIHAPKTEYYDVSGGNREQRQNSVISISSDSNRGQFPAFSTQFARRSSASGQATSVDSGISWMSSTYVDSKISNDSGYASQELYGGYIENTSYITHN